MFIGNIAYERETQVGTEFKRFGKLWYGEYGCSLLLHGWRQGHAFCKPFDSVEEPPYLNGDILIPNGEYEDGSITKKAYQWCGYVWTESDQRGAVYQIVLEVDPTMLLIHRQIEEYDRCIKEKTEFKVKTGLFLKVLLTDR